MIGYVFPCKKGQGMKKNGFTLIELCIVIGIVLLFVAFAAPSFSRILTSHRLEKEATHLALVLTQARQTANYKGTETVVRLDSKTNWVTVEVAGVETYRKQLSPSISIDSAVTTFMFEKQTLPSRQEILLLARNGESRRIVVEPFLKRARVK